MSYCQPQWVSDFTYQGLLNNQRIYGASVMQSGVGYLVRAALTDDGATLEPVYALDGVTPDAPQRGEYTVELLDAAGALLASHTVAAVEAEGPYHYGEETVEHDHDHRHIYRRITAVVPAPVGPVARFRLIRDGVVIAERANDAAPPAVAASATIARNDATWTLSWSNATVPALVRYTHDGKRWTSLGVDLVGGRLSLDPQTLPGDGHGRFEIVLADGGGIIIVDGTLAAADDAQPQAWIDGPATLPVGAPLLLYGRASDREDGALDELAWQVNGVSAGRGQTVFLDNLAPGEYHVRLTARDSAGNVGYVDHLVRVEQR
jgi:PKD domain.